MHARSKTRGSGPGRPEDFAAEARLDRDGAAGAPSVGSGHPKIDRGEAKPQDHEATVDDPAFAEDETSCRAEALDPDVRRSMELGPPAFVAPMREAMLVPPGSPTQATSEERGHARLTVEEMLPALVRRIAWGGNGQRGSVRMELGAGTLAGGTVVVHADDGKVRVEVSAPSGADPAEWRRRIDARLREHGLDVESVEVV